MIRRRLTGAGMLLIAFALALGGAWLLADRTSTEISLEPAAPVALPLPAWTYEQVADWPDDPRPEVLYVGTPAGESTPIAAMLLCPCGCGDRVRVSLREQDEPHWDFRAGDDGRPTLQPSIWRNSGCESHFTLIDGRLTLLPVEPPVVY